MRWWMKCSPLAGCWKQRFERLREIVDKAPGADLGYVSLVTGRFWSSLAKEKPRLDAGVLPLVGTPRRDFRTRHGGPLVAEWSRPVFAGERPVYIRLPTFGFGPRRRQTAVTLNRSQRSSTCRALSFSARSLRSPLRSNMA